MHCSSAEAAAPTDLLRAIKTFTEEREKREGGKGNGKVEQFSAFYMAGAQRELQGSAKLTFPGCENAVGKLGQKW